MSRRSYQYTESPERPNQDAVGIQKKHAYRYAELEQSKGRYTALWKRPADEDWCDWELVEEFPID